MYPQRMNSTVIYTILRRFMSTVNGVTTQPRNHFKETQKALPEIEVPDRNHYVEVHHSARKVKHGDIEFIECNEGYILTYINSYIMRKEPLHAFYGVYYGRNNPLNMYGPVNGKQSLEHAQEFAVWRLIEAFPNIEAKKLCICSHSSIVAKTMKKIGIYSENGYRNVNGLLLQNIDTYRSLNKALRVRNDLQLRLMYTPSDVIYYMKEAEKLAKLAAKVNS